MGSTFLGFLSGWREGSLLRMDTQQAPFDPRSSNLNAHPACRRHAREVQRAKRRAPPTHTRTRPRVRSASSLLARNHPRSCPIDAELLLVPSPTHDGGVGQSAARPRRGGALPPRARAATGGGAPERPSASAPPSASRASARGLTSRFGGGARACARTRRAPRPRSTAPSRSGGSGRRGRRAAVWTREEAAHFGCVHRRPNEPTTTMASSPPREDGRVKKNSTRVTLAPSGRPARLPCARPCSRSRRGSAAPTRARPRPSARRSSCAASCAGAGQAHTHPCADRAGGTTREPPRGEGGARRRAVKAAQPPGRGLSSSIALVTSDSRARGGTVARASRRHTHPHALAVASAQHAPRERERFGADRASCGHVPGVPGEVG